MIRGETLAGSLEVKAAGQATGHPHEAADKIDGDPVAVGLAPSA